MTGLALLHGGSVLPDKTPPGPSPEQDAAAVCAVLRWAVRSRAGEPAAREVCEMLGVDLAAAVGRPPRDVPAPRTGSSRYGEVEQAARHWLRGHLAERGGAALAQDVMVAYRAAGIGSMAALQRARRAIGITNTCHGRKWTWVLPAGAIDHPGGDGSRPRKGCGTYVGYRRHIDYEDGEPCEPCREAKRAYVRTLQGHRDRMNQSISSAGGVDG